MKTQKKIHLVLGAAVVLLLLSFLNRVKGGMNGRAETMEVLAEAVLALFAFYAGIVWGRRFQPEPNEDREGHAIQAPGYLLGEEGQEEGQPPLNGEGVLEALFGNTSEAILVTDAEGTVLLVNPAFAHMFGWSHQDCLGWKMWRMAPDDLHEELRYAYETVLAGGHISEYETKRLRINGETIDVSASFSPIADQSGSIRWVVTVYRSMMEVKQLEASLADNEARLRLLADNMTDIISVLSPLGKIEYISPSCEGLIGFASHQLIGKHVISWMHPEDIRRAGYTEETLLQIPDGASYQLRFRHADGNWIMLEVSRMRMATCGWGDSNSILLVARDITERKKAEALLVQSEKLSVVGQLAAGVAHEIRNPLTSLKGFLQLLHKRSEENGFYFELMLSELDRINNIVSEFLMLSKPQAISFRRIDVLKTVQKVIDFLSSQALLNNVQIEAHFPEEQEVYIEGDENQLKQVFINLLKNAIEAMPEGGAVDISLERREPDKVLIRFADQGPGIPEEKLAKLGQPFYTTKEKGTGLGLMVTFRIVQEHGGEIHVQSEVGLGTVFEVNLPVNPAE